MKKIFQGILFLLTALTGRVYAQGWYAEIDLDLNHGLYAFESITNAQITFSGVTVSGSSTNSNLRLTAMGTGPATGSVTITAAGTAWQPYDPNDPYSQPLPTVQFNGTYDVPCETAFFEMAGNLSGQVLYIWIKVHPRLEISDFILLCEQVTLVTSTCSSIYNWEVSDSPTGNFKALTGKSTPSITVTRKELIDLGFTNPYGRKYFRVTGRQNTTSQLQPIDIFYPGPTASLDVTPPTCHNGTDGSVALDIKSANPDVIDDYVITLFNSVPPTGQLAQDYINDGGQKSFSGLAAGSYWVRIENNTNKDVYGNCWTDYAVGTLKNPEPVRAETSVTKYSGYGVRCAGSRDGKIEVIPSGGSGAYAKFEWTPQVSTTNVASNLAAGTYQVKVTDTKGCSSQSVTSIITAPSQLSVNVYSEGGKNGYDVSCHDKADGRIQTTVTGGAPGYNYLWSDRNVTPWITDVPVGDYSVSVSDANGCTATAAISLNAPPPINFSIEQINPVNCPGDDTGALEAVYVTNTIGQIHYAWSSGEIESAIFNKASGVYTVSVSDDQGCQATRTHTLAEPAVHKAGIVAASDFHGVPIKCNGTATGELRATVRDASGALVAGQEYTWFRNNVLHQMGQDLATLKSADAATYRVKIRYDDYCTTEATFVLNEPGPIAVVIKTVSDHNGVAISCNGSADGSIQAAASGGTGELTFLWNTGATTSGLSALREGAYTVTAKDVNDCSAQSQIILADPEPVKPEIKIVSSFNGSAISCTDASDGQLSATAAGGTAPYNFVWSNGASGTELQNVPAGAYTVAVTDVNGCVGRTLTSIVAPVRLEVAVVDSSNYNGYGTRCAGNMDGFLVAAASGGTGSYRYQWPETKTTTALNSNLPIGTYNVVAIDTNGCIATASTTISGPKPLIISDAKLTNVSCHEGRDGQIELHPTGGTGVYHYSTDGETWQAHQTITNLQSGVYQARARDTNGCIALTTETLTEPDEISIAFTRISAALCGQPIGEISTEVIGGNGGFHYQWTDANANIVSDSSTASGLPAGIYELVVTDRLGCQVAEVAGITSTDGPKAHISEVKPATCSYSADGHAKIEVTEGEGPFSFMWNDGQSTSEAFDLGKGTYLVQVTDIHHCTTIERVIIPGPDSLTIELVKMTEPRCFGDCNGQISTLAKGGTGPYTYDWQISSGPVIKDLCTGEYVLKVKDQQMCEASKAFRLSQPDPITVTATLQQSPDCPEYCNGQLELQATGGTGDLVFSWNDGRTGPALRDLCPGDYTTLVRDSMNCTITETFTLKAPVIIPPDLGESVTLCVGQTHLLDAGPGWEEYAWFSDDGLEADTRSITITDAGTYWLEARTAAGCTVRDTFLLKTSTDLLQANFLIPTTAFVSDTVVLIDISWPVPEKIGWNFPPDMAQLDSAGDFVFAKFDDPGVYAISLSAKLASCVDELTKTITIINEDEQIPEEGRLGNRDMIKEFALYPNPNDGMFEVVAHFTGESPIVVTVWNVMTSKKIAQLERSGKSLYREHIDLRPMSPGSYSLRLDYSKGSRYIRFIVR